MGYLRRIAAMGVLLLSTASSHQTVIHNLAAIHFNVQIRSVGCRHGNRRAHTIGDSWSPS
jgi:hypothetical protein